MVMHDLLGWHGVVRQNQNVDPRNTAFAKIGN